jgi:hypothetical protein
MKPFVDAILQRVVMFLGLASLAIVGVFSPVQAMRWVLEIIEDLEKRRLVKLGREQ